MYRFDMNLSNESTFYSRKILMIKILEMSSQNYRNGIQEWDEKLEQCPYYPSHQIRPTRFGHHLLQCRKALSKQPTSPYYHKIDDLVVSKEIFIRQ